MGDSTSARQKSEASGLAGESSVCGEDSSSSDESTRLMAFHQTMRERLDAQATAEVGLILNQGRASTLQSSTQRCKALSASSSFLWSSAQSSLSLRESFREYVFFLSFALLSPAVTPTLLEKKGEDGPKKLG